MHLVSGGKMQGASALPALVEIQVLAGELAGQQLCLLDPQRVRIGRDAHADLASPAHSPHVCPEHLEIVAEHGHHVLRAAPGARALLWPGGAPLAQLALGPACEVSLGGPEGPRCRITRRAVVPFGRYLLTGRLGAGGMAEVYVARQTGPGMFNREVVLKLIRLDLLERESSAASMFLDEARIAAEINHPNVVHIYDAGEERGTIYIAMEYLRGVTLASLSRQLAPPRPPLPCALAAALISPACAGLHAAHELRRAGQPLHVVHRDVSPSNIMVSMDGLVKVIDFGIVRAEGRLQQGTGAMLKGKPAYMAPEQIRHHPLDRRTDVFAAALVLHELCSRARVFERPGMVATLQAALACQVPPLSSYRRDAPGALTQLLQRALSADPAGRPGTAQELQAALDALVQRDGRFTSTAAIARALGDLGLDLIGPAPTPVEQVPGAWALLQPRAPAAPPPLPRKAEVPLTLVLEPDPDPDPPTLPETLRVEPSPPEGPAALRLEVPPPGAAVPLQGPGGRPLRVASLELSPLAASERVPLPLGADLLPAPLTIGLSSGPLVVEVPRGGAGSASLYHDAYNPASRCQSYPVPSRGSGSFDVGHRRARIQKVFYHSAVGDEARPRPEVPLLDARLQLVAARPSQRLCVFCANDPRTGELHITCVTVLLR